MSETGIKHGIICKKSGMTRIFFEKGFIPVTVLVFPKTRVLEKIGKKVKILAELTNTEHRKKINQAERGHLLTYATNEEEKNELKEVKRAILKEVDCYSEVDLGNCQLSSVLTEGQLVDITGTSIGKGFTGVMKRWNFKGLRASHGVSLSHRSQGSTGQRQDPGRVMKGKKMAGHLGCERVTVQNLKIVKIMPEHNIVLVKGSIPGATNSLVLIRKAIKKS